MAAFCLNRHIRSEPTRIRKSTRSIPTAVASNPIAAITAPLVTRAGKSDPETSCSLPLAAFRNSLPRGRRKLKFRLPRENMPEISSRLPRAIGSCPGVPMRKGHLNSCSGLRARAALRPVLAEPKASVVQPTLVAERAVPNRHPSGLHDWPNANLLCLNAYTSKYPFAAGSIHSVRLYTRDSAGNTSLLGTAPVERDGSFFVQVPTEQPLQIELLDASGKTLKRESGILLDAPRANSAAAWDAMPDRKLRPRMPCP